ncbi:MAG TPA: TolC family protein [Polyangiaceae bacterium]|nr:TolC family protein [Polyangiaceae bacterium]
MMRRALALAAPWLVACASTSPTEAVRDTAKLVEDRTGRRIFWNEGGQADALVARRVRELVERELSVDSAVAVALLNNRHLQAVYEDLSVAQADLVQAGLLRNPTLSGSVAIPVTGSGVQTGFGVGIMQEFLDLFFLSARRKVAGAELEATELRVTDEVLRTTADVEVAFYALIAAQQIVDMRRTVLDAGDAAVGLAEAQHAAGNIGDLDLANERALFEQVRTDLKRSEIDCLVAREALTRLLGVWGPSTTFRVPSKLPDLPASEAPVEHLETIAVARRADLASARAHTQALAHAAALAKNGRFLGGAGAGAAIERSPERYTAVSPGVSLEIPVFDQRQAAIARLEALVRQSSEREGALAVDIRSEVRVARGRLLAARDLVERYAKVVVPLREQVVKLSQEQYGAMLLGAYQLLAAKQNEVNAYREFIESLREYWIARVDVERAIGASIPGALPPRPTGATPP